MFYLKCFPEFRNRDVMSIAVLHNNYYLDFPELKLVYSEKIYDITHVYLTIFL